MLAKTCNEGKAAEVADRTFLVIDGRVQSIPNLASTDGLP